MRNQKNYHNLYKTRPLHEVCKKGIKIIDAFKAIEEEIKEKITTEKSIKLINVKVGNINVYNIIFDEALQTGYEIHRQQDASEVILGILQRLTDCTEKNQKNISAFTKLYKFKEEIEYKLDEYMYKKDEGTKNILKLDLFNINNEIEIQNLISNERNSDEFVFPLNDREILEFNYEKFRDAR